MILTGPPCKNPAEDIGLLLAKIQKKIKGDKYRSKEIQKMAFGPFDKIFQGEPKSAWICSDREIVDKYNQSDLCGFTFTTDAFEVVVSVPAGASAANTGATFAVATVTTISPVKHARINFFLYMFLSS